MNDHDVISSIHEKPGYHLRQIQKGVLGESSKILEEVYELIDAEEQKCKIMSLLELADLVGAIEGYLETQMTGMTLEDLRIMSNITKRVFISGHRS